MSTSQHAKPEFEQGSTKGVSSTYDRSALAIAVERVAARQHLPTPNSSPASRGGLPSSNSKFTTHLPTPQSPGNKDAYASLAYDQGTPTRHKSQRPLPELNTYDLDLPPSPSFLTPESSPLFPRKGRLSRPFRTPSPKTTSGSSQHEATSVSNGSQRSVTPPPMSLEVSPAPSGLSSPFMDKRSNGHSPSRPSTPKRARISSPADDLMVVDDVPLSGLLTAKASPSLQAPVPQRPVGGEIHRIRLQLAVDQAARQEEAETRRPEYLKRHKRSSPDSEYNFFNDPPEKELEVTTLGITESPVKGRRITLFQATSEESFEQSLFTSGFQRYGATPAYNAEPQTPKKPSKPQLSRQAVDWLQHATPGKPAPPVVEEQPEDWIPSEKEIAKRRRLAAFEGCSRRHSPHKLFAVEIDGKGRVLVDQPFARPETPPKPKPGRKRKGRASTSVKKGAERPPQEPEPTKPNWLDGEFPWAVRNQERSHLTQVEQDERMKVIERFLDRSSSDEEEDEEDQSLKLSLRSDVTVVDPPQPIRRGRGKMIPLKANPEPRAETINKKFLIPSDPADARVALLSKRSVRSLAFRKRLQRARENDDSDEEAVCACGGADDGRELVQCDECRTWYHLSCIGIKDISELGKEEDPWYCPDCLGIATPSSDPTFVPNDPSFFQSSSKMSLNVPWGSIAAPNTPMNRGRGLPEAFSTRSIWETTPQAGPSTPRTQFARLQQTPNTLGLGVGTIESPFDPTSTPSRGMQFSGPFTTPRAQGWSSRNNLLRTPTQSSKPLTSSFNFTFGSTSNKTPPRTVYTYEETPIQRSRPKTEKTRNIRTSALGSPLSSRAPMYPLGLQDSPLGGKKVRGRRNPSLRDTRQNTPSPS